MRYQYEPEMAALILSYALEASTGLTWAVRLGAQVENSLVSAERVLEFGKTQPEADWDNKDEQVSPSWPSRGEIRFEKYSTRYRENLEPVLRGIDLEIGAGERVGIVGGANLSVGERQLVCLARALLRQSTLLILDEATAAVDLDTDALIQTTIRDDFKACTVITIAHRLHTIMDYDKIIVLDKGQVVEMGSPQELLEKVDGMFSSMAKDANIKTIAGPTSSSASLSANAPDKPTNCAGTIIKMPNLDDNCEDDQNADTNDHKNT
ncbi:canalicular multispecific organic anion transporter 1 [Tropilaelaps mercedesae]|uniref:Canalicular multispecific organic anion transporter 1 n=1 Tax=Tropilaelaps mercedesae TaxID=418985 RepID=A0A1V9XFF3_9ACAR|nr:canalicular multispecific organic anion transporter 1 [Tropilaelaps mercedesae]